MSRGLASVGDPMLEGRLRIGGEEVAAESGRTYAVSNPATGTPIALVAEASQGDVCRAVGAAAATFSAGIWRRMPAPQRGDILRVAAGLIEERAAALARLESLCSGKPISDCLAEVHAAARYFRFYGAAVNHMTGQTIPVNADGLDFTLREPIGVCALIVPWNGPIAIAAKKAAPALAAGNSIVLKPAPPTPLTALELEGICRQGRRAAGRLQRPDRRRTGSGPAAGGASGRGEDQLHGQYRDRGRHPHPSRGRDQAGQPGARRQVTERDLRGRRYGRGCFLRDRGRVRELGPGLLRAQPDHCSAARPRPVRRGDLTARARQVRQGDPLDPGTRLGSLISSGQRDRVLGFISRAVGDGAEVICGGTVVPNCRAWKPATRSYRR